MMLERKQHDTVLTWMIAHQVLFFSFFLLQGWVALQHTLFQCVVLLRPIWKTDDLPWEKIIAGLTAVTMKRVEHGFHDVLSREAVSVERDKQSLAFRHILQTRHPGTINDLLLPLLTDLIKMDRERMGDGASRTRPATMGLSFPHITTTICLSFASISFKGNTCDVVCSQS